MMFLKNWIFGAYDEIEFWNLWIRTRGAIYGKKGAESYANQICPNKMLDEQSAALLPENTPVDSIKILDVGSGPINSLGTLYKGQRLTVIGADPLAISYKSLHKRYHLTPSYPHRLAYAEDLNLFFDRDEFDLVVCQNALDHTFDPCRAIKQMVEVSKPGGYVLLRHGVREGENQDYDGLHQWNLDLNSEGDFVIWNKSLTYNINQLSGGIAEVKLLESNSKHLVVAIYKMTATNFFDCEDSKRRLKELLIGLSETASSLGREGFIMRMCFSYKTYSTYILHRFLRLFKKTY